MYLRRNIDQKKICILLLIVSIFFPYSFQGIKIAGVTLTVDRLIIIIISVYCLFIKRGRLPCEKNSMVYKWSLFFLSWITLGVILTGVSDYVSVKPGIKELLSLVYGIVLLLNLAVLIQNKDTLEFSFRMIRILCIFMIMFGVAEILTGRHFVNSIYNNEQAVYARYISQGLEVNNHTATGFLYGVNDFASFLGVFTIFLFVKNKTVLDKIWNFIMLGLTVVILLVNDANIVLMAVVLSQLIYLFLSIIKSNYKKNVYAAFGIVIISAVLICFYFIVGGKIYFEHGVITSQLQNYQLSQGSLYARLTIYKDTILAVLENCFVGYGPASFTNYFTRHKSLSELVNPHSLAFEIVFNYGGLVFLVFFGLIYSLMKKNFYALRNKDKKNLIILVSIIIYLFVSFSPSSFLAYSYQWLIIGLGCLAIDCKNKPDNP